MKEVLNHEKINQKITGIIISAAMVIGNCTAGTAAPGFFPAYPVSAESKANTVKNRDYKTLYKKYLLDLINDKDNTSDMFDLYDMDSDGIPELFISSGFSHAGGAIIFSVKDGKVVCIGSEGSAGVVSVSGKYLANTYIGSGEVNIEILTKKDDSLSSEILLNDCTAAAELFEVDEVFHVNQKHVSEKEYVKAYTKYNNMEWMLVGRRYPLAKNTIDSALKNSENNAEFNHRKAVWKKAKKAYLSALKKDFDNEPYGIWLGDFNGDGIEEMIAAYNQYGSEKMYYYNGKEVSSLSLDVMSDHGFTRNIDDRNMILSKNCEIYNHGVYGAVVDFRLYKWNGRDYRIVTELDRDGGFYDDVTGKITYGQAYINGKKVSNERFEKKLKELNDLGEKYYDFYFHERLDENGDISEFYTNAVKRLSETKGLIEEYGYYIYR